MRSLSNFAHAELGRQNTVTKRSYQNAVSNYQGHPVCIVQLVNHPLLDQSTFLSVFLCLFTIQVTGVVSVFFIVVSIVSFCLKTHPDMRVPLIRNVTVQTANNTFAWTLDKYQVSQNSGTETENDPR